MRFNLGGSYPRIKLPSILYSLELYKTDLSATDIISIEHTLRRYREQKKYPYVSFLMVVSETKSQTASKKIIKTGKRGRPKKKVTGTPKPKHVHVAAICKDENHSANKFMEKVKTAVNKRLGGNKTRIVSKGSGNNAGYFIYYSMLQASSERRGGDFNFEKYRGFCFPEF